MKNTPPLTPLTPLSYSNPTDIPHLNISSV